MGYKISLKLFKNKKNKKSYNELQSGRLLLGHPVHTPKDKILWKFSNQIIHQTGQKLTQENSKN